MRRKVTASRNHICDLCHGLIEKGETCYKDVDDFMPGIVLYEHVTCPGSIRKGEQSAAYKAAARKRGRRMPNS
ncbi:MAG: hypothetical protein IKS20_12985 [Victivallales bacterium]|nr:hypothetical protein [Victivallales bacterium]